MKALILMIQFMTRYPIPMDIPFTIEYFVRGMKWMPLVGLLVALPAATVFLLADAVLGREIAAIFAVILLVLVTGGLHLDGIADTADGLFSYRSRERMLEIMRESTLGVNGVIAIVLAILGRYTLLCRLPEQIVLVAVLSAPILGRMALVWHSAVADYARAGSGLGAYVNQTGSKQAASATMLSLVLIASLFSLWGMSLNMIIAVSLLLHVLCILPAIFFALYVNKRLGGITGDTIGATIEMTELNALFFFLFFWTYCSL